MKHVTSISLLFASALLVCSSDTFASVASAQTKSHKGSSSSSSSVGESLQAPKSSMVIASELRAAREAGFMNDFLNLAQADNKDTPLSLSDIETMKTSLQNNLRNFDNAVNAYNAEHAREAAKASYWAIWMGTAVSKTKQDELKQQAIFALQVNFAPSIAKTFRAHAVEIYDAYVASQATTPVRKNWATLNVYSGVAVAVAITTALFAVKTGAYKHLTFKTRK